MNLSSEGILPFGPDQRVVTELISHRRTRKRTDLHRATGKEAGRNNSRDWDELGNKIFSVPHFPPTYCMGRNLMITFSLENVHTSLMTWDCRSQTGSSQADASTAPMISA